MYVYVPPYSGVVSRTRPLPSAALDGFCVLVMQYMYIRCCSSEGSGLVLETNSGTLFTAGYA